MAKRKLLYASVASVLSLTLAGQFVCSPVFAEGPVNISIVEVVNDGGGGYKPWEDITGAMPGMTYSAIPRVKNDGMVPVPVRMCLSESAVNATGESIALPANAFGINIGDGWTLDNNESGNPDDPASGNCYKYNNELAVGDVTEPIFTEVALNSSLGNEYNNSTFNLHLEATAVGDEPAPVNPDDPGTNPGTTDDVNSPDTGSNTYSYLEIVSPVLISAGSITIFAVIAYIIRYCLRRRSNTK